MNTLSHTTHVTLDRDEPLPVRLSIEWLWDEGNYLERDHPYNGGAGWYLNELTAHAGDKVVELTAGERAYFADRFSAEILRDATDRA